MTLLLTELEQRRLFSELAHLSNFDRARLHSFLDGVALKASLQGNPQLASQIRQLDREIRFHRPAHLATNPIITIAVQHLAKGAAGVLTLDDNGAHAITLALTDDPSLTTLNALCELAGVLSVERGSPKLAAELVALAAAAVASALSSTVSA